MNGRPPSARRGTGVTQLAIVPRPLERAEVQCSHTGPVPLLPLPKATWDTSGWPGDRPGRQEPSPRAQTTPPLQARLSHRLSGSLPHRRVEARRRSRPSATTERASRGPPVQYRQAGPHLCSDRIPRVPAFDQKSPPQSETAVPRPGMSLGLSTVPRCPGTPWFLQACPVSRGYSVPPS